MNHNKAGTHIRLSGSGDLNTASVKDFLIEGDDGGMPRGESEGRVRPLAPLAQLQVGRNKITYHIPSICLPTSCIDIALTIPLLRSYTYNFTGEDMVVVGVVIEGGVSGVIKLYTVVHEGRICVADASRLVSSCLGLWPRCHSSCLLSASSGQLRENHR